MNFRLESATRSLKVLAPKKISLESAAGNITISCLSHLKLESPELTLDAKTIILKGLSSKYHQDRGSTLKGRSPHQHRNSHGGEQEQKAYQLCACPNGKLFLAESEGICVADVYTC